VSSTGNLGNTPKVAYEYLKHRLPMRAKTLESDIESIRSKLNGLAGIALSDGDIAELLAEVVSGGGGVHIELDDATRYRLIRRDGRFVLSKDSSRGRLSSAPPRR
jgi:hypothetical protein